MCQAAVVTAGIAVILINFAGVLSLDTGMTLLSLAFAILSGLTIGSIFIG